MENMWIDRALVAPWLPEGTCGRWSVRRRIVSGDRRLWYAMGGYRDDATSPPGDYTELWQKTPAGEFRRMTDDVYFMRGFLDFHQRARGRVLMTGLGLGMAASWLAQKPEIELIDVVEIEQDVIELVAPHLPSKKINVVRGDAYSLSPRLRYDYVWHDCFVERPANVEALYMRYADRSPYQDHWRPDRLFPSLFAAPGTRRSFLKALAGLGLIAAAPAVWGSSPPINGPLQEVTASSGVAASSLSFNTGNPTKGNSLILCTSRTQAQPVSSVSGLGLTWNQGVGLNSGVGFDIWFAHNASVAGGTVTVTTSGKTTGIIEANLTEWSGLNQAAPDATNINHGTSGTPATGSVSNSRANSLIMAGVGFVVTGAYSSGPTGGFTRRQAVAQLESASDVVSALSSYSTSWSLTGNPGWVTGIASFGQSLQKTEGFFTFPA